MTALITATVQTLTAEVRVLQVGSRQVTQSVYNQLDRAPIEGTEVFGRIKTKDGYTSTIHLVGRNRDSGALVRTSVERPDWRPDIGSDSFYHWLEHTYYFRNRPDSFRVIEGQGRQVLWKGTYQSGRPHCPLDKPFSVIAGVEKHWALAGHDRAVYCWLAAEFMHRRNTGQLCDLDAIKTHWTECAQAELDDLLKAQAAYDAAKAEPLIILAGLR